MNILLVGGSGFLGTALAHHLALHQHTAHILTRQTPRHPQQIQWDGKTTRGWLERLSEMDAVVNLAGYGLEHWPWTQHQKQRFLDSRIKPGLVLTEAFEKISRRPGIFIQTSGINRYGLTGTAVADETTPPGSDFLAQLTIGWENSTRSLEQLGVRRVITRTSVVLAARDGQFPLMALPVKLFFGGKLGDGQNALNWIHVSDYVRAVRFLIENNQTQGPFNLIAPELTTGEVFMRTIAKLLGRPFWFHIPKWLLRIPLGEMSVLLTEGRPARTDRLLEAGFQFEFGTLSLALSALLQKEI